MGEPDPLVSGQLAARRSWCLRRLGMDCEWLQLEAGTEEEKDKVQAQKEEVLSHMNDLLENELQCIICSEYFIEAVTLNCAHSFCSFCINEWMKRKVECPICRKDIESRTNSLVLDNCISKMVDNLSSDVKERRSVLIRERRAKRLS
ncbi:ring finger protein 8 [Mus musculus]|nr:ring finger protein 8 [Mus musculus]